MRPQRKRLYSGAAGTLAKERRCTTATMPLARQVRIGTSAGAPAAGTACFTPPTGTDATRFPRCLTRYSSSRSTVHTVSATFR